ncbi:MAG TPA: hypothetical protein VIR45_06540 [Kiloniellaceae bacterium]
MRDRIIGITAIIGLVAFLAVLLRFVSDIDLVIIVVVVALMAAYDFYLMLFTRENDGSSR